MSVNWKKLRTNIPNKVHVGYSKYFEILWTDDFVFDKKDDAKKTYGITRFEPNQIVINKNQSDKETVLTAVHEMFHALRELNEIGLTESQVTKLEKCFKYLHEFHLQLEKKKGTNNG